ncbi:MAG: M23 family metallopeptidase [Bacteroidales bacterium]|nr:M23 family metallopeptidase [Bacteroidales bacterium]
MLNISVRIFSVLLCFSIINTYANDSISNKNYNINPPLDIDLYLSGTYGEIRTNHFHSGIDIKTQGTIGKPVYSIEDGYVYRIKVSSVSYGKTLYIMHNNGLLSVYGHLDHFIPQIDEYVKKVQYDKREFEIDIFPPTDFFTFKKSEQIAYSGNSGYSFGPHLHFEIRDSKTEIPVNPLFYINIADNIPPKILNLVLYPMSLNSYINYKNEKQFFPVYLENNTYKLTNNTKILITGQFSIGIEVYDLLNNSDNKCGIYSIELYISDTLYTKIILDNIPFNKTRYINSFIDYEEKVKNKKTIQKLFIEPNNKLPVYITNSNNGIIDLKNDSTNNLELKIYDANNNSSQLRFQVVNVSNIQKSTIDDKKENYSKILYYNSINEFIKNDIEIVFPENCLYTNINFIYAKTNSEEFKYSPIHHIHNIYTPVHNKYKLTIKPDSLPEKFYNKAFIGLINEEDDEDENKINSIGGEMKNGFITAYSNKFGKYIIEIDTLPPTITPLNFNRNENDFTNKDLISFTVKDDFSELKSYNGFIDEKWVLFEYNKKNNLLFHVFDNMVTEFGKKHKLQLIVVDEKNNINEINMEFIK